MRSEAFSIKLKKATVILVVFSLSFHCLFQLGFISYFISNQDFIVKELCINRNNPEVNCQGRCYLETKMAAGEHENNALPTQHIQLQEINFYFVESVAISAFLYLISANDWLLMDQDNWYPGYPNNIFHPPQALWKNS